MIYREGQYTPGYCDLLIAFSVLLPDWFEFKVHGTGCSCPSDAADGGHVLLQDIKLANAAAWNNLGAANEEDDGQKGAEEEEDGGDPMWNTFQSRDDIEREKVSTHVIVTALICTCSLAALQSSSDRVEISAWPACSMSIEDRIQSMSRTPFSPGTSVCVSFQSSLPCMLALYTHRELRICNLLEFMDRFASWGCAFGVLQGRLQSSIVLTQHCYLLKATIELSSVVTAGLHWLAR